MTFSGPPRILLVRYSCLSSKSSWKMYSMKKLCLDFKKKHLYQSNFKIPLAQVF